MKAADLGNAVDLGLRRRSALDGPALRRISQLRMDSACVVVLDVLTEKASKRVLVQNGHVVEQFAAYAANPSLGDSVLLRALECRSPSPNAEISSRVSDPIREDRIVVENEKPRSGLFGKSLAKMLGHLGRGGVLCDSEVENLTSAVANHEPRIEAVGRPRWAR